MLGVIHHHMEETFSATQLLHEYTPSEENEVANYNVRVKAGVMVFNRVNKFNYITTVYVYVCKKLSSSY